MINNTVVAVQGRSEDPGDPGTFTVGQTDNRDDSGAGTVVYLYHIPTPQGDPEYGQAETIDQRITLTYGSGGLEGIAFNDSLRASIDVSSDKHTVTIDENGVMVITDAVQTVDGTDTPNVVVARYQLAGTRTGARDPVDGVAPVAAEYSLDAGTAAAGTQPVAVAGNWTGLGAKVTIPAGEGASFILGYSQMEKDLSADDDGNPMLFTSPATSKTTPFVTKVGKLSSPWYLFNQQYWCILKPLVTTILDVCRMTNHDQWRTFNVRYDMTLPPLDLLPGIITP
ncbi:MAG: hypothetical protein OXH65_00770 [Paracoccaceae bacterium]|nr:hypothetical protein [Paracoccaceae bacterium]